MMSKKAGGQQDAPDFEARWKRAVADYRNLEARVVREREELARFSNFVLISNLLPVLDDLEGAAKESADGGVAQILKKFREILTEAGLEEIAAAGKEFDPAVMEGAPYFAKATEGKKGEEGLPSEAPQERRRVVVAVVRKGYNLHGRLLRPARVEVGNN